MNAITSSYKRLCNALPETSVDAEFRTLSRVQRLLVLAITAVVAVGVPPQLVDQGAQLPVATALVFLVLPALSAVLAWLNRR